MAMFNQVTFIARIGKDPKFNFTPEGIAYLRFSIAVDQGKDQKPMWLNVVCWRELAERSKELLFSGAQIFVQGRLQERTYTGKDRVEKKLLEIVASTIQLLEKRKTDTEEEIPEEVLSKE
jgi:single-strand DNA-binding protein